ncbi:17900_t:CDS:2, partial [Gigaspora rosea]
QEKAKLARSARNKARATKNKTSTTSTRTEYDSDDLTPVDSNDEYDFQEDDYFREEDIDRSLHENGNEDNNSDMIDEGIPINKLDINKIISETIEFVNDVI